MNAVWKLFLWMSFFGSLLILVLLVGKCLWKNRISRQWQYYIWLAVIARLLLPFSLQTGLTDRLVQAVRGAGVPGLSVSRQEYEGAGYSEGLTAGRGQEEREPARPEKSAAEQRPVREIFSLFAEHIWLIWLTGALILLIRRVTVYQSFLRYVKAGAVPVSDIALLDRLALAAGQAGIKRPVELCVNPLVSSPLLTGFFHPCIVLPCGDISEQDFRHIALHELTHCRRLDPFYKWLVQVTVCLHWFNPLVYLMSREITKACEFSCDEAVVAGLGEDGAPDYGRTLLDAMAAVGSCKETFAAVTLGENKRLLKERLEAIMRFRRRTTAGKVLTGALTLGIGIGAALLGGDPSLAAANPAAAEANPALVAANPAAAEANPAAAEANPALAAANPAAAAANPAVAEANPALTVEQDQKDTFSRQGEQSHSSAAMATDAERYYEADNFAMFQIAFLRLDEEAQGECLEQIYAGQNTSFFAAGLNLLDTGSPLIQRLAEKAYADHDSSFFSILCSRMEEEALEEWLERASEDQRTGFQTILLQKLGWDEELEAREAEWEERQLKEYRKHGITREGKAYYYQGQPVNIFLDCRFGGNAYTLEVKPEGVVNIRVIRNEKDEITDVTYMTEAEVAELFGDMESADVD